MGTELQDFLVLKATPGQILQPSPEPFTSSLQSIYFFFPSNKNLEDRVEALIGREIGRFAFVGF